MVTGHGDADATEAGGNAGVPRAIRRAPARQAQAPL